MFHVKHRVDNRYWLFCIALILHNIEEALFLPAWSLAGNGPITISSIPFRVTLIVITLPAVILTVFRSRSRLQFLLVGYAGTMFLNVFFPHLIGSIVLREILPGLITSLLLILPSSIVIIVKAARENGAYQIVKATTLMTAALLIIIPVSYTITGFLFQ